MPAQVVRARVLELGLKVTRVVASEGCGVRIVVGGGILSVGVEPTNRKDHAGGGNRGMLNELMELCSVVNRKEM